VVRGALNATLTGRAVFGPVRQAGSAPGSFSLDLGAYSAQGAVVFSRVSADRPAAGTYSLVPLTDGAEGEGEFHALVSLGAAEAPVGVFRAIAGSVTITESSDDRITGRYELKAVGFLAADPDNEGREITVRGSFTAEPAQPPSAFDATFQGAVRGRTAGSAEFGPVNGGSEPRFSLSLGAYSQWGAVALERSDTGRPEPGVYRVSEAETADPGDFHGVVITGSPGHPSGAFRVRSGSLMITESTAARLSGRFELHAVGFLADSPEVEGREIVISGSFSAAASGSTSNLSMR
jgi:hypothetical protein